MTSRLVVVEDAEATDDPPKCTFRVLDYDATVRSQDFLVPRKHFGCVFTPRLRIFRT